MTKMYLLSVHFNVENVCVYKQNLLRIASKQFDLCMETSQTLHLLLKALWEFEAIMRNDGFKWWSFDKNAPPKTKYGWHILNFLRKKHNALIAIKKT